MNPLHIFARKKREQAALAMVALSDAPSAQIACDAGIDAILVGDSLGNTALGFDSTIPVTMDAMAHHLGAVVRGVKMSSRPDVPIIADMPFGSYATPEIGVKNAVRLMQIGAHGVKIEGTQDERLFRLLKNTGIPVMGHIGFTPQSVLQFESIVQGKSADDALILMLHAEILEQAGCFAVVLEAMTENVARQITTECGFSTIGIGAGANCDGQILVWHDIVGLTENSFKFTRAYAQTRQIWTQAVQEYRSEVENRVFPTPDHSWRMTPEEVENWAKLQAFNEADPMNEPLDEQPF
jgi:3-methyl-2-oxobutanoate hydroxymethyltransferase